MKRILPLVLYVLCIVGSNSAQDYSWMWAKIADESGGTNIQRVNDVVVDSARGFVYVVGGFEGTITGDFGTVSSHGDLDGFIAKFNLSGGVQWVKSVGENGTDELNAIDIEETSGDIFVGGYGEGDVDFDGDNSGDAYSYIPSIHQNQNAILAKYDVNGVFAWAHVDGGHGNDKVTDLVVVQNTGKVVYCGTFFKEMELGSNSIDFGTGQSQNQVFVVSRNINSTLISWRSHSEGNTQQLAGKLSYGVISGSSYVFLLGDFNIKIRFYIEKGFNSSTTSWLTTGQSTDLFYAGIKVNNGKFNSHGFLKSISSPYVEGIGDIMFYNDKLYISGSASNNVSFDGMTPISGISGENLFVSKHDITGIPLSNTLSSTLNSVSGFSIFTSLTHNRSGSILAGGWTFSPFTFDGSNNFNYINGIEAFVAVYDSSNLTYQSNSAIYGGGTSSREGVKGLSFYGDSIYVGGFIAVSVANFDADIVVNTSSSNDEDGFLSLLNPCNASISYPLTICKEQTSVVPVINGTTGGTFSEINTSGLNFPGTNPGEINPWASSSGSHTVVYTLSSVCADTVTFTISPATPPAFTNCPTDTTLYVSSGCTVNYSYPDPSSSANYVLNGCGNGSVNHVSGGASSSAFGVGKDTIVYVLSDGGFSQNDTCRFIVTVLDTVSPTITCPSSITVPTSLSATTCSEHVNLVSVGASDNCGISPVSDPSNIPQDSVFSVGTTTLTYTVSDIYNNSASCSYDVIVVDATPPSFVSCSTDTANVYVGESSCNLIVQSPQLQAEDNCGNVTITLDSGTPEGTPDTTGLHVRTYIATDDAGNTDTCRYYYRVLDTISPTITCPSDITTEVDITTCSKVVQFDTVQVSDNCSVFGVSETSGTGLYSGASFSLGATVLTYQVSDVYGNFNQCSFTVDVVNNLNIQISNDIPKGVCFDSDSLILANYEEPNGGNWSGLGITNGIFYPDSVSSPASVEVVYSMGTGACFKSDTAYIGVYNFFANAGTDDTICGLSYGLNGNVAPSGVNSTWIQLYNETYSPSNGLNTATVTVPNNGVYSFVWELSKDQCIKTDTVTVVFYEQPIAYAGANITVEEDEVQLDASLPYGTGYWTIIDSDGQIDDSTAYNTWVFGLNLGLNIFQWTISNGTCPPDSAEVQVFYNFLQVPNAFSPNGDGVNDVFEIVGFDLHSDAELTILDRWGEVLFFTDSSGQYWDGKHKGKDVVEDTYFYILKINNKEYTGYIELRR